MSLNNSTTIPGLFLQIFDRLTHGPNAVPLFFAPGGLTGKNVHRVVWCTRSVPRATGEIFLKISAINVEPARPIYRKNRRRHVKGPISRGSEKIPILFCQRNRLPPGRRFNLPRLEGPPGGLVGITLLALSPCSLHTVVFFRFFFFWKFDDNHPPPLLRAFRAPANGPNRSEHVDVTPCLSRSYYTPVNKRLSYATRANDAIKRAANKRFCRPA